MYAYMHSKWKRLLDELALQQTGVPIYVQLRDQLMRAIGSGLLGAGEQMPTMREVAVALRIDLNTVRRAYDELERTGAVTLQRGRGSFVSTAPPALDPQVAATRCEELARQTLSAAGAAGVDPRDLAARILALSQPGAPPS